MGLVANTRELPIVDFLQVKGLSRSTCRILVEGRQGTGVLVVERGEVVYASYADSIGEQAAHEILLEPSLDFSASSDAEIVARNMRVPTLALVMDAARRLDEDGRRPQAASGPERAEPAEAAARPGAREADGASAVPASPRPPRAAFRPSQLAIGAGGAVVVLAGLALAVSVPGAVRPSAAQAADAAVVEVDRSAPPAVEASVLSGPRDLVPRLVAGGSPANPDPDAALRPTVVCRLLVDASGTVQRAEVFQRRPELSRFEDAALDAVRRYRFEPARRDGAPVAAWVNWPVAFE